MCATTGSPVSGICSVCGSVCTGIVFTALTGTVNHAAALTYTSGR
jgi:hypothetical protein